MKKIGFVGFTVGIALFALVSSAQPRTVTVITHDSFNVDAKLVRAFEARAGVKLAFVKGGDAGAMVNKLVLAKGALADAVFGIDNTLLGRALGANLLEAYRPKAAAQIPVNLRLDPTWRLTPVDYGFVALNYDRAWFTARKLALPKRLEDLTQPVYKGLLAVPSPATSSTGLAFYLATVKTLGERGALGFWARLRDNGARITAGWDGAYYTEFTRNGGARPIVVSYASSPAAEVFFSKTLLDTAPTANLLLPGSAFLQIEGVGVLRGAKNPAGARAFVDFMLEVATQRDIPTQMWVYPVLPGVPLHPVYRFADKPAPAQTARLEPATVSANSARWLDNWTRVVVRGANPADLPVR
jgi:thiamine transport system substrate-binding protein